MLFHVLHVVLFTIEFAWLVCMVQFAYCRKHEAFLSLGLHGGLSKVEFCMEMRVLSRGLEVILAFYVLAWLGFRMGLA